MTTHRGPERPFGEDGFVLLLREGRGYERCYDVFAPALYRYCWTLLDPEATEGGDAPGTAVRETFLAAVELLPRLRDRSEFRPWLFALARAACQRRGFAQDTPYGALPAVAEERSVINTLRQLPPSQRELLELSLRHGLSHTQIAAVLGLAPETVGDLCRSTVRLAADLLSDEVGPDGARLARRSPADVPGLLLSIALPGPPRSLRERVVSGCVAPAAAPERTAAGAAVRPLGPTGFPLHRSRGAAFTAAAPPERPSLFDDTEEEPSRGPVPADRITTFDLPAPHGAEPLSELAPEIGGSAPESPDGRDRRSRWLVPVVSGLATALVAFGLWGVGVFLRDMPESTVVGGPPPADQGNATPLSASETVIAPEPSAAPTTAEAPDDTAGTRALDTAAPDSTAQDGETAESEPAAPPAPEEPVPGEGPAAEAPAAPQPPAVEAPAPDPAQPDPGPAPAQPQQPSQRPGGVVSTLLGGVWSLLGLDGGRAAEDR